MKKIIVVEINDCREVASVTVKDTIDDAVKVANELLIKHCELLDRSGDLKDSNCLGDFGKATPRNRNAWSNLGNENWDAHIIEIDI